MTNDSYRIVTLTMNPAIDISTDVDHVISEHKLRCGPSHHEAGGGGINVARVLHRLGEHPLAIYCAGGPSGNSFTQLMNREPIATSVVAIEHSTRESFTVDETSSGEEFRFVLQGPQVSSRETQAMLDALTSSLAPNQFVVASGSLPPGVPDDFYAEVARLVSARGGHCIVDASGEALKHALDAGVFMVKPSLRELEGFVGRELSTEDDKRAAARELVDSGAAEIVALSLGADGAMLVTADLELRLPAAPVEVRGTVGAGDSFVAGFVFRLSSGASIHDAFVTAVAAGSATAERHSTRLCTAERVFELERQLVNNPSSSAT